MAVVVITGSSSGFGLEGALAFARHGDTVYASMRDLSRSDRLQAAADKEQLSLNLKALDVNRPADFDSFIKEIVEEAGRIDVLVNNAGIVRPGALEDLSEASIRLVMETNFFGPLLLTKSTLPQMRLQGSGTIIMVSSLSGLAGLPGDLPYSASKFALEGATESLRHEVDRWGIRLALVEAGMYSTSIFDSYVADTILLPDDYPADSPYRTLIESRLGEIHKRRSEAFDPRLVGELFVSIAHSDGSQFRWPADAVATKVLGTMLGHDDAGRDQFLRMVAGTDWWSQGKNHAD